MSDTVITDHNKNPTHNSKAEARVDSVAKANPGSNSSHFAEPLSQSSAADVHMKDEERQESNFKTGEEAEEEEVVEVEDEEVVDLEEEELEKEVKIIGETKGGEEEVEGRDGRKGAGKTGASWGETDSRYRKVKVRE